MDASSLEKEQRRYTLSPQQFSEKDGTALSVYVECMNCLSRSVFDCCVTDRDRELTNSRWHRRADGHDDDSGAFSSFAS